MNYNNLCYQCFCEKPIQEKPCPQCGYRHVLGAVSQKCLPPGTLLQNRYIVGVALGVGGFGITYKCLDTEVGGICAIKEYFPSNYAQRESGTTFVSVDEQNMERYNKIMNRFVEEAELVKSFNHRNVITIYDNFFQNKTAYYVMEYCDGIDLRKYTDNFRRKLGYEEGMNLLYQVMNGLEYVHSKGILHRDIAPDNIFVTKNKSIKILDFGSARSEMDQFNRELSVIVKVGYAPIEQYGGMGKQGAYTDIYALGATFYHLFTGKMPVESTQRVAEDILEEFSRLRPDLPDNLKYCIEKSMELTTAKRISNIAEMRQILNLKNPDARASKVVQKSRAPQKVFRQQNRNVEQRPIVNANVGAQQFHNPKQNQWKDKIMSTPPVSQNNTGGVRRASIAMRMGAYAIDLFFWGISYYVMMLGAFESSDVAIGLGAIFPIVFAAINTISEMAFSTTVGKALLKMYVRGRTSIEVMPSQILLRNIVKMLGVFVVVFAQNEELLEDKTTNSIVCIRG